MKILVCGSRDFSYEDYIINFLDYFPKCKCTTVITGYCRGADKLASECAKMMGMTVRDYPASWTIHNHAAGILRNIKMLEREHVISNPVDMCVYFVYPKNLEECKGTNDMVIRCKDAKDIEIVDFMNILPSDLRKIIQKINDKTNIVCNV